MTDIYLAEAYDNESDIILGIFSTVEKAKQRCEQFKSTIFSGRLITKYELDKPTDNFQSVLADFWRMNVEGKWVQFVSPKQTEAQR